MTDAVTVALQEEAVLHFERLTGFVPPDVAIGLSLLELRAALAVEGTETHLRGHAVPTEFIDDLVRLGNRLPIDADAPLFRCIFPQSIVSLLVEDAFRIARSPLTGN